MKTLFFTFIFSILSLGLTQAQSVTISDVELKENVTVDGTDLVLNGAGIRTKFFFDLYVGSLYLPSKKTDAEAIIHGEDLMRIQLNIISSMITSEKMESATREGFENATNGKTQPIEGEINAFIDVFKEEIKEGDVFQFDAQGPRVTVYKNGNKSIVIEGKAFREALFGIWLSNKPADKKLKEQMLGK
ncbi:chalcone isomerase family protein [Algivirga pacifica]|uniref:Chalcone isomerase family protein n=1 Tax=Algivirga pacifica TaxID=1162670 RepID=A0ABP9DDH3_9BACT